MDSVEPLGATTTVYFSVAGEGISATLNPETSPTAGTSATLSFNMHQVHLFDKASGVSLACR
ncbi:TOBE domain-containing protein [Brucella pituitosa]|nr:TOBE domain-containing protein [Brucella pituitosa]